MSSSSQHCNSFASLFATTVLVLLSACRQQGAPVLVEAGQPARQIRVNGIATMEVNPDVVDLTLTLSVSRARPKSALTTLHAQQTKLVAALIKAGVANAELRLSHVNVSPRHKPHPNSHVIDGYSASVTLVATLSEFERLGDVMEAAASHEVSQMYTRFRSTKLTEKKKQVREMALKATRDKAGQIATSMQVELGEVLAIEEVVGNGALWGAVGNENMYAPARAGEKLQPGAIELSLTVEVAYALE
jgi:uncharacterized protein YggE